MPSIPSIKDISRLLIVKTSSIGDVVHALPVVEQIKRANPAMEVDWLVKRRCLGVLEGNPWITKIQLVPDTLTPASLMKLRRDLHERKYDCAVDMQGLFVSGLCTWLSGAPVRIGIDRNREGNRYFLTHPIVPGKPNVNGKDRHAVDILFGFADILGATEDHTEFEPQPYLAEGQAADFVSKIAALRQETGSAIGLNVGASSVLKQWPVDHWVDLGTKLIKAGMNVVFVGDKRDAEIVGSILPQMPDSARIVDASGKTTLRQLAAVLQACDLLVTGDTGPMHLAVAVGTPTVALFGSTNPIRTGPYGARNIVLDMHLDCSPCYRKPTCHGRVDCMKAIASEAVFTSIMEKLRGSSSHGKPEADYA